MNPGSDLPSSEHFSHQECSLKYKSYSWINRILGASGLLVVATLYTFIRLSDLSVYIGAVPENLVAGVGHLPYQYRVLIPWVVTLLQKTPLPGSLPP
ncbi:MAG: hypothetical protein EBZ48_10250 [Proteobacteria bacterium]|nr:hypothetical protein [Pseudomonadota bacterium]